MTPGIIRSGLPLATVLLLTACGSSSVPQTGPVDPLLPPPPEPTACISDEMLPQHPLDLLPVLSYPVPRGGLARCEAPARTPSTKIADGSIDDWTGTPSYIGGTTRLDAGESIHTEFLFDAYGADDGSDAQRLALLDPLAGIDARIARFDALQQALGDQLGVPRPFGAEDRYGNSTTLADEADLSELRWAAQRESVFLLARWSTLTDPANAVLLVLLDTQTDDGAEREIGFDSGLRTQRYDHALLLAAGGALQRDLVTGSEDGIAGARVVVNADGWTNALEAELPASLFAPQTTVAVVALRADRTPANVAYRASEPVTIYSERLQALALAAGTVDDFSHTLDLDALRSGASETVFPAPGYHERQFTSADNISSEGGENGRLQPYGLYIPSGYSPQAERVPLSIWLHYRGGKAHSGAAWTPRLIQQLGEEPGHPVITPRGRGTSTWYVSQAHQDVFEVLADAQALLPNIDPQRRYLSGYSMGGYGTYLFGLLYPDRFAAGYATSGAVTQGAWTGFGPDDGSCGLPGGNVPGVGELENPCFVEANEGDANAQLTFRLLENARHFPITIHHGTNDQLALTPGALRMGLRLAELGYRHDMTLFAGYEHFTQAIVDEWADGAAYLRQFAVPEHPRRVTYKLLPAMIRALNTVRANDVAFNFAPDGAWWVDELVVRDADDSDPSQFGMIDAESHARPGTSVLPLPRLLEVRPDAVSTPVLSIGAHSTPYVRTGLDWIETGEQPIENSFTARLTGLAAATLDVPGMGLDLQQPVTATVTTDSDAVLTLRGVDRALAVRINGEPAQASIAGDRLSLSLPAGTHNLSLDP
jgi:dienelactone hydrolase